MRKYIIPGMLINIIIATVGILVIYVLGIIAWRVIRIVVILCTCNHSNSQDVRNEDLCEIVQADIDNACTDILIRILEPSDDSPLLGINIILEKGVMYSKIAIHDTEDGGDIPEHLKRVLSEYHIKYKLLKMKEANKPPIYCTDKLSGIDMALKMVKYFSTHIGTNESTWRVWRVGFVKRVKDNGWK